MEFAGAVGAFFDANAQIVSVTVTLAFDAPDGYLDILTHGD